MRKTDNLSTKATPPTHAHGNVARLGFLTPRETLLVATCMISAKSNFMLACGGAWHAKFVAFVKRDTIKRPPKVPTTFIMCIIIYIYGSYFVHLYNIASRYNTDMSPRGRHRDRMDT